MVSVATMRGLTAQQKRDLALAVRGLIKLGCEQRDMTIERLEQRVKSLEVQVDAERSMREMAAKTEAQIERNAAELSRVEADLALLTAPPAGLLRQ